MKTYDSFSHTGIVISLMEDDLTDGSKVYSVRMLMLGASVTIHVESLTAGWELFNSIRNATEIRVEPV
jgi:hypothetical protein